MSLRSRIIMHMFIFVAIIIATLWLIQSVFLDDIYMHIKKKDLFKTADSVVSALDRENNSDILRQIAFDEKTCIFIYDLSNNDEIASIEGLSGRCDLHNIVYRKSIKFGFELDIDRVEEIAEKTEAIGSSVLFSVAPDDNRNQPGFRDDNGKNSVILSNIIYTKSGNKLLVVLNSVISPLASTVETLNTMLLHISWILLLLALVFSVVISQIVSRPISDISSSAKKLAKGDYKTVFEGKGFREVEELAGTLNYASTELSKVDKLKNDLIANISHDLRTPITLISGYAEMMRDIPDEMSAENLQIIIDESVRMKGLVNDVLDISKLQSGNVEFEYEKVALTNCIESELTRYNKLREKEGYRIDFRYDRPVHVMGDAKRLMQVLYNLVNNAVTYTGNDKTVSVIQSTSKDSVRISVVDSGEGIEQENMPYIWDRYFKVDKSHKRVGEGSGLGLSIVKTVIEAHKGKCGVESAKGFGSTFWFELRLAEDEITNQT